MTEDEIKTVTNSCFMGTWTYTNIIEKGELEIQIKINRDEATLVKKLNGKEVENNTFFSDAHWFDKYLSFITKQNYYIIYANESAMRFGELENPGVFNGQNKWLYTFQRK